MLRFSGVCFIAFVILPASHLNFAQDVVATQQEMVKVQRDLVKMHLYTKSMNDVSDWTFGLDDTDLDGSSFNRAEPVVVIFHGFQNAFNHTIIQLVKNAFVRMRPGWNVIVVDWAHWSKVSHYEDAVNGAHSISSHFGQWLSDIVSKGYTTPDQIQLVGFSIGAHMAGIVAKFVQQRQGKVAKIFALDPAFPLYERKPDAEKLRKEDAAFVQTIHTCGHHVSYETSIGHVDFYPNGGQFPQADCLALNSDASGLDIITTMICSHTIVLHYFAESVVDENKFVATKCGSWTKFQEGNCSSERAPMGFGTPTNVTGDYYLDVHLNLSKSDLISWMPSGKTGGAFL